MLYGYNSFTHCLPLQTINPRDNHSETPTPKDSLHVKGRNTPNTNLTVKTHEGHSIPLGAIKKAQDDKQYYWSITYSEYVVPKDKNIMVRYIIKLGDGTKFYTRKDLYMKDGEEEMESESDATDGMESESDAD